MTDIPILHELVIVIGVSLTTVGVGRLLRIPTLVGFLLAGVIIGPGVLGLVRDRTTIEVLAEIGVVFLLFTIGLQFSLRELVRMRTMVLGVGGAQVGLTLAATALLCRAAGLPWPTAVLLGMLVAMTSTTIMMKILEGRGEIHSPHGRLALAISIFQDLSVIPMMLVLPLLGGVDTTPGAGLVTLLKTLAFVVFILVCARYFYPWLLHRVVQTRSREMFAYTTLFFALGTAYAAGLAGISLSLGAFLAGIMISESDYSHQIITEVTPLRDSFSSLFFVSVGMMVEPAQWILQPLEMLALPVGVVLLKAGIVVVIGALFGYSIRVAVLAGLAVAQVGEFSFILAQAGRSLELLSAEQHTLFLSLAVVTMAVNPLLMRLAPMLTEQAQRVAWLERIPFRRRPASPSAAAAPAPSPSGLPALRDHVVVVGYSVNGRNVAHALRRLSVPYLVLEMNPRTVLRERALDQPVLYGDATQVTVQRLVGMERARALVVSIADPAGNRQIISTARRVNPDLLIIVRTRFISEVDELSRLGANDVVVEEFETSLELTGRVMAAYGVPVHRIARQMEELRRGRYEGLRSETADDAHTTLRGLLSSGELDEITLEGDCPALGRSLRALDLRARTGVLVVGLERREELTVAPDPDLPLAAGDVLFLWGKPPDLLTVRKLLSR